MIISMDKVMTRKYKQSKGDLQSYLMAKVAFCIGLFIIVLETLKLLSLISISVSDIKTIATVSLIIAILFGVVSVNYEKSPKRVAILITLGAFILAQFPIFMLFTWLSFFAGFSGIPY